MADKTMIQALKSARVQFYSFLSGIYEKEISKELLADLAKMNFDISSDNQLMSEGYAALKNFFAAPMANLEDELAADFAKTFLAAGQAKGKGAFPYESVYTSKEKLVMQQAWVDMTQVMAENGVELKNVTNEIKEDHIAAELAFMGHLVETAEDAEALEFLNAHLLNWAADFAADVEKYAGIGFYPAITKVMVGFLQQEAELLAAPAEEDAEATASFCLSLDQADAVLAKWQEKYHVWAPKVKKGSKAGVVRYQEIGSFAEVSNEKPSDFSAKETYYPIMQTMFYFTDTEVKESKIKDDKGILLLLHPCDINAMRRLDNVFLKNGGNADMYYKRLRDKVKVVLLECKASGENCFCVSMNSNTADKYDMAVRLGEDKIQFQVKNQKWEKDFEGCEASDFTPKFITENKRSVKAPVISDRETLALASNLKYWEKFDEKCMSCGGCNTVCPTCSCFDTIDVIYDETSRDGERRRVWSSCMLDTFTMTAGGARARKTPGANMRFKTLHKMYDYDLRFNDGESMCVGCGRCVDRCPKDIDFAATINEFTEALESAKAEGGK